MGLRGGCGTGGIKQGVIGQFLTLTASTTATAYCRRPFIPRVP